MYELAHPWALALLPAPLLVTRLASARRTAVSAVRLPFLDLLASSVGAVPRDRAVVLRRTRLQMATAVAIWVLTVIGIAGPEWVGDPIERTRAARDVMLAVDISGSMDERDFAPAGETTSPPQASSPQGSGVISSPSVSGRGASEPDPVAQRLAGVHAVLRGFIEARSGDRMGIIVFGSKAYVQLPFTEDTDVAVAMLEATEVGMAGPHTVLGDAIGLAIRTFEASDVEERLLILLSDGSDTGSRMPPLNAAEVARDKGVTIHTVGVGDPNGRGESRVDFATLEDVARRTRGRFFSASDTTSLAAVYDEIDAMTPRKTETISYRPRAAVGHWPAGAAATIGLMVLALLLIRARRQEHG